MKKFLASASAALLILTGVAFGSTAANATETPEVCVPSEAWTEVVPDIEHPAETHTVEHPAETHTVEHDAVYESVLVTPAVEYQPAVYETEYEFVHKFDIFHLNPKWKTDSNWNAESNPQSKGWIATGNTRQGALISEEVLAQDAVYEDQLVTEAWTETVIDKEAWTETVIDKEAYTEVVPDIEHAAVECPPVVVEPEPTPEPTETPAVVTPTPTETPAVVTPTPTETPSATPVPVAASTDTLAQTGGPNLLPWVIGGGVILLLGAAMCLVQMGSTKLSRSRGE